MIAATSDGIHRTPCVHFDGKRVVVAVKSGNSAAYYVDGSSNGTTSASSTVTNSADLAFGVRLVGSLPIQDFDGKIDDIMIIGTALSANEVAALHSSFTVTWDENGNIATNDASGDITYTFNWDNKLRKAIWNTSPEDSIEIKYDPLGNRVYKKSTAAGSATEHKYIVDITGKLPVILMDLNLTDSSLKKTYIYANRQILAQHDIDDDAQPAQDDKYFYFHDRLGSVRLVIADDASVAKQYTYEPYGEAIEDVGSFDNAFMFTGQYFDYEIEEYYLRARQYNPGLARFTSRDPVQGQMKQPLTLHKYLYCENDPVNRFDPNGASSRSAAVGNPQFRFEHYVALWNAKSDPEHTNEVLESIWWAGEFGVVRLMESAPITMVSGLSGFIAAGPNMYRIAHYRLLQNGMINAILREDFGVESDIYDYQDFLYGF